MSERQYGGHFSFKDAATPAASAGVAAAWKAFQRDARLSMIGVHGRSASFKAHRPLIEAAIRAESAGALDAERLARALRNLAPIVYEALPDIARESAEALAAEYARLADPTP